MACHKIEKEEALSRRDSCSYAFWQKRHPAIPSVSDTVQVAHHTDWVPVDNHAMSSWIDRSSMGVAADMDGEASYQNQPHADTDDMWRR